MPPMEDMVVALVLVAVPMVARLVVESARLGITTPIAHVARSMVESITLFPSDGIAMMMATRKMRSPLLP
jgi:hypothetical protein